MRRFACFALATLCVASPSLAQRAPMPSPESLQNHDIMTIGVGGAILPDYEGSDDYRIIPAASIRGRISGVAITTNGTYLYVDPIRKSGKVSLDAGPIAGLRLDSIHHADDPVVKLLPERHTAIEVGAFAGASFRGLTNPYDTLAVHVDVLHDIGNAHKSTLISPNVTFSTPVSRKTYVSAYAALDFAQSGYAQYYFGVTPANSLLTGGALPVYTPGGGLKDWKTSLLVNQSITGDLLHGISVFAMGQYSHLNGDFSRSPLVAMRGSAGQWLGAAGFAYTW